MSTSNDTTREPTEFETRRAELVGQIGDVRYLSVVDSWADLLMNDPP